MTDTAHIDAKGKPAEFDLEQVLWDFVGYVSAKNSLKDIESAVELFMSYGMYDQHKANADLNAQAFECLKDVNGYTSQTLGIVYPDQKHALEAYRSQLLEILEMSSSIIAEG